MKKTFLILFAASSLAGIMRHESAMGAVDARTGASELVTEGIHYTVAKNYFVNNNLDSLPPVKITSAAEFEKYFGMATTMGKDGRPTAIDFSKQYVIAVTLPVTDTATVIKPKGLVKSANGDITFSYAIKRGKKQSYSIQPLLLVVTSKKNDGNVTLKAVGK